MAVSDPWRVGHGLLAMGHPFAISGAQRAVDVLLRYLTEVKVGSRASLAFPLVDEIHPNMLLMAMLEAGVPLNYGFTHNGQAHTLTDLVEGARLLFEPERMADPNMIPWSLIVLSRTTSPVRRRWTNAWGKQVDLDAAVGGALQELEAASAEVGAAMRAGRPLAKKPPVHSFTCGGGHMLYGLLSAVHYGFGPKDARKRVEYQTALMIWRMGGADVDLISRFYARAPRLPLNGWREFDAKLKTLGHAEECVAFATTRVGMTLTSAQQAQRAAGLHTLHGLLTDLRQRNLDQIRALDVETYRTIIGDTCHAEHGLTL